MVKIYHCSVVKHKCKNEDCLLDYASGKQGTVAVESHDSLIHAKPDTVFTFAVDNENEDIAINKMFLENFQCESE